jgi:hypothetical protein
VPAFADAPAAPLELVPPEALKPALPERPPVEFCPPAPLEPDSLPELPPLAGVASGSASPQASTKLARQTSHGVFRWMVGIIIGALLTC